LLISETSFSVAECYASPNLANNNIPRRDGCFGKEEEAYALVCTLKNVAEIANMTQRKENDARE
jgi:hypothetical protein